MSERFAIYFAPATEQRLWQLASQWLGRDARGGPPSIPLPDDLDLAPLTLSARRYGFHATLKPPMALRAGTDRAALDAALAAFTRGASPLDIGPVELRFIDGFLAIVPRLQSAALTEFAAEIVTGFDVFRAPMSDADRQRRLRPELSARQRELLDRYGYPYVLEQFQFHMTLTDRLAGDVRAPVMAAAKAWFTTALEAPLTLDRLALFHQPATGADFARLGDYPLAGTIATCAWSAG